MAFSQRRIKPTLQILKGRPDLTAVVDILFLLLIFFMLSSSFVQISGIKVELPETLENTNRSVEKFVITVDPDSHFFFNDEPLKWEQLEVKLLQIGSRLNVEKNVFTVIVRSDRRTPFGTIAKLMGLIEKMNLNAVFATGRSKEGEVFPE